MKVIIYTNSDGSLHVINPAPQAMLSGESEAEFIDRIKAKDVPNGLAAVVVDSSAIPTDRTFRAAWERQMGDGVAVDMGKARKIHKDVLRQLRAPKLAALDAEFMRAVEIGDAVKQADIATQKQALRDVTDDPAITTAKTPEELKAVIPPILVG